MGGSRPRGELAELDNILSTLQKSDRNRTDILASKRQVFQKVVAYMTMGMDMSPLLAKVISAANLSPDDVLLKKMMYYYICTYAKEKPELALMAINQLQKDCKDADPQVRGLALRSLCSLRVANLLEYVVDPILHGLKDDHPYVKRTAVMGVLKVYHIDHSVAESSGLLSSVSDLLSQSQDPGVVGNCLSVIAAVDGYSKLTTKAMVYKLLTMLKEFSDWHQCQVLEIVSHYRSESEQEVYDIMNILEDRLTSANTALAVAVIKVFLFLTLNMPATHQQVLERVREPLRMIISREQSGATFAVLSHVLLLAQRAPVMFAQEYTTFFCRTDDPFYIKQVKLEILAAIVDNANAYDIATELTEYVRDVNPNMAREAVKAVGKVALAVPDVSGIIERLIGFLEYGEQEIISETLVQMKDLLRRFPDMCEVCIPSISAIVQNPLSKPDARSALAWILGQHGEMIPEAPYVLESLVKGYDQEEVSVRLVLLSATAKLFFKRPPECRPVLGETETRTGFFADGFSGALLVKGMKDTNQDIRDRALLYYRLLKHDVKTAESIIDNRLPNLTHFSEDTTPEMQDKIFDEFNTLSVIYKLPASMFIDNESALFTVEETVQETTRQSSEPTGNESSFLKTNGSDVEKISITSSEAARTTDLPIQEGSLLDLDDLLGGSSTVVPQPALELNSMPAVKLSSQEFQTKWQHWSIARQALEPLPQQTVSNMSKNNHEDFCLHMKNHSFHKIASGGDPQNYKYFFYAQPVGEASGWYLVEVVVFVASLNSTINVKTDLSSVDELVQKLKDAIKSFNGATLL
eukprot:g2892.t1